MVMMSLANPASSHHQLVAVLACATGPIVVGVPGRAGFEWGSSRPWWAES